MFREELLFSLFCTDLTAASITLCICKDVSQDDASATVTSICQIMHQTANVTVGSFLFPVPRREHLRTFTTTNYAFLSHLYLRRPILKVASHKSHANRYSTPPSQTPTQQLAYNKYSHYQCVRHRCIQSQLNDVSTSTYHPLPS